MSVAEIPADRETYHLLSLAGGGFLGLYTVKVLELLEARAGIPLARHFDLLAGSSIGGLLALALASAALVFLALLVTWTPHPAALVQGVQGRYFIVPALLADFRDEFGGRDAKAKIKYAEITNDCPSQREQPETVHAEAGDDKRY